MHPKNNHQQSYKFDLLIKSNPFLEPFVFRNNFGTKTIDFSNPKAVFQLNKSLLKYHYQVTNWNIPEHYLCPAIPGRADYIHYLNDLLNEKEKTNTIKGLDIGVGANCIYPILGAQIYHWDMVGTDIDTNAIAAAKKNSTSSDSLKKHIEIRYQKNNAHIFEGIISENEYFDFTMCNPPFHSSKKEATKGTLRKLKNLKKSNRNDYTTQEITLNFGGQANELWCNGGEVLFIKRMIKQSIAYKNQVGWFTTLVSKKEHLGKIYKQLEKLKATHKTIAMSQGAKNSRFVAWTYT